uniref:Uncharacterized protein n=1 Tax=Branchiostoma floridae TaxID=7739 RepID=C3YNE8_BRAFL|eukprot:XP_002602242.1 hypothetical protein BRAFLDRAFT_76931 [Branchiostoma floridae]
MADEAAAGAVQAAEGAAGAVAGAARQVAQATPVIDFSANGFWGGVTLTITDSRIAAGVVIGASAVGLALVLSRFYRDNRDDVDDIIRRVIERLKRRPRRDGEEPQLDPEVLAIQEGSLYVHVGFRSEDGYDFFSALYDQEYIQTRLKEEFKTLGFPGEIRVSLERSQVPGREEEEERAGRVDPGVAQMFRRMRIQDLSFHGTRLVTESESGIETASVSAQSGVSSDDVPEGPLRGWRLLLQPYRDSPTAQRLIQAYRTMERGAEILINSEYTDVRGLTLLAEGIIIREYFDPKDCNHFLYHPNCLRLDKDQMNSLITNKLKHNPGDSSCLFLQGALLPWGIRVERLRQTVNTVLQNGEEDPLHAYLHHICFMLALSIWDTTYQPGPAFAALATALMYKSDHPPTLYYSAIYSAAVSRSDAIQQFHHYLRAAPPCDEFVQTANNYLAMLYGGQQPVDWEKVETYRRRGQEAERNLLPVFNLPVSSKPK